VVVVVVMMTTTIMMRIRTLKTYICHCIDAWTSKRSLALIILHQLLKTWD
jgi:hypothetical protein